MSHPILGNKSEVNGDFSIDFSWNLYIDENKGQISIKPLEDTLIISNEYYKYLFDTKKIFLFWNVTDSKTFFLKSSKGFNELIFRDTKIGGLFEINCNLCSSEKFIFDPPKGSVNDFFLGKSVIEKGCILSINQKIKVPLKSVNIGGATSILKFKFDDVIKTDYEIDFQGNTDGKILIKIKNNSFVELLRQMLRKKKINNLVLNNFFSSIFIEAIRLLNDNDDLKWKEELKSMIDYDENKSESYEEFNFAFLEYNSKLKNLDFFNESMNDIKNII
jgi:hypothetical protein